jgi:hypothetical protein
VADGHISNLKNRSPITVSYLLRAAVLLQCWLFTEHAFFYCQTHVFLSIVKSYTIPWVKIKQITNNSLPASQKSPYNYVPI